MTITAGTAANIAGYVVPTAVSLVTVPLYIQFVGYERYGILLLIWVLVGYFGLFDLGLGRATTQRIAALAKGADAARARVFWTAFLLNGGLGVLGGVVLLSLAEFVLTRWVELSPALRAEALGVIPSLAAAVPLLTVSGVLTGTLQARERFASLNLSNVVGGVLARVSPLVVAIAWEPDVRLLVPAILLTRAATCLVLLALCRRHVPLRTAPAIDRTSLRPLLGYGGWVTATSVIDPLLTTVDRFVIGALIGAKAVTLYSVPSNLVSRLLILPASLSLALFPRLTLQTVEESGELVERAVRGLAGILTPTVLVAMVGMRPFLTWWVGDEFSTDAAVAGQIVALGLWFNGLACLPHTLLEARSRPDLVAKCHILQAPLYVGLLWAALQIWGVVGAAVAWSVRAAVDAGLLFWFSGLELRRFKMVAPSALLLGMMTLLMLTPAGGSLWHSFLVAAVLVGSVMSSWRSGEFLVGRLVSAWLPVRART